MQDQQTVQKIHRLVDDGTVPGVSWAMIDHSTVTAGVYGNEQLIPTVAPLIEGETYDVASLTKVIGTLSVILQLLAGHQLELNNSVREFIPEWQHPEVTIRHLLTHTSGITGYIPNRNQLNAADLTSALLKLDVGENFGIKMVYQDVNYLLLGWVAERILGWPIQRLIQERVLTPLGMTDSTFHPVSPEHCVPTENSATRGLLRGRVHDPKAAILGEHCGSAGLFSTKRDLVTFCRAYLNPTQATGVLPVEWVTALTQDWTPNQVGRSLGWALWESQPQPVLWQTGFTGTALVIDPATQRALVFLSNRIHPDAPNLPFLARRNDIIQSYIDEK
ncbi:serine hydrolase domain-containing protein [Levilactobacillus bambusae]|uniref:serine hydrolase domain-containing protein n=1 Tax=Levilactobacillus bambusae TaxID=2024736 RepID=UPI001CDABA6E|nr:serine hydrolase domain-containing protein [Levilactobacillus bambusae]